MIIYGHYDVQSVGPPEAWTTPAFEPEIRDGRIYGRGTSDDKGNFLPLLHAACELARAGELPVHVRVLVEGEEEAGGETIAAWVAADERGADAAIVFDSGMENTTTPAITVGLRGVVAAQITVTAQPRDLHSGMYGGSVLNALHVLHGALAHVVPGPEGAVREELRAGVAPVSAAELASWEHLMSGDELLAEVGARPLYPQAGEDFRVRNGAEPAVEVNWIEGGAARTIVPAVARAFVTMRLAPRQDAEAMSTEVLERLLREDLPSRRRDGDLMAVGRARAVRAGAAGDPSRRRGDRPRHRHDDGVRAHRRVDPGRRRLRREGHPRRRQRLRAGRGRHPRPGRVLPAREPGARGGRRPRAAAGVRGAAAQARMIRPARVGLGLAALGLALAALLRGLVNYDTLYSLVWGRQLAQGQTPDLDVPLAPTPHPLGTLLGVLAAPLSLHDDSGVHGGAATSATLAVAFLALAVLGLIVYELGRAWFDPWVGVLAAVIILTRRPVLDFGARAYIDIPYVALVLGALLVETRRPRAGVAVLALLAVAGLIRPEAWLFSGAYVAYLLVCGERDGRRIAGLVAIAASGPLLWMLSDWIVAGDPLHSLTGTRDTAKQLGRITGIGHVPTTVPRRLGEILREPVLFGALGGLVFAWLWLRSRVTLAVASGRPRARRLHGARRGRPADPRPLPPAARIDRRDPLRRRRVRLALTPGRRPPSTALGVVRCADARRPARCSPRRRSRGSATCGTH